MKKPVIVLISILAAVLILSFVKDALVKASAEGAVKIVTGLNLRMQSVKVGIFKSLVGIKNLRLFNPQGFKDRIMLEMPEIYVDYVLSDILKGNMHLTDMRINMQEFTVVKNEQGELNLDSLKVVQAQKEGQRPEEKDKEKAPQIQIDSLKLRIGKVVYKDYSGGGAPTVREFNINLNEQYENISNPYSLVSLIVVKALMNTTIASLTDFDLGGLKGTVSDTLASAQKIAVEAAEKAQAAVKETTQKAKEAAQKTQEAVEKTAEELKGLKDTIKLPFGSKSE